VSKFDFAVDFQMSGFELPNPYKDIISRARKRKLEGNDTDVNTMTLGTHESPLQVQIYNKTEELKVSHKHWMFEVWRNENTQFTESLTVWRIEYRFSREKLRKLGIYSISDLSRGLGNLMYSVLGGEGYKPWMRICSSDTRHLRQDHRPAAPWWEQLKKESLKGMPSTHPIPVLHHSPPNLKRDTNTFFAYLERLTVYGVAEGRIPEDATPEEVVLLLAEQYSEHLQSKGMSFSDAKNARAERMGLLPTPPLALSTTGVSNPLI